MSHSKQAKHQQRRQLRDLKPKVDSYRSPPEAGGRSRLPRSEEERQALVERKIQEAMAEGAFDNLPGQGKPLPLDDNPYLEPGQELAFGLLKRNGFAPEWIERDKEIRFQLEAARERLQRVWQGWPGEALWQAEVDRFEEQLNKLNRKIDDFNLIVPVVSYQRSRLRLADELRRVRQGHHKSGRQ